MTLNLRKNGGEKFDVVICSCLLHEIDSPTVLLNAISNMCTKDTLVHINVPNVKSLHRIIAKEAGLIEDIYEKSERNIKFQQNSIFDMETLIGVVEN